jgi:LPXTG-motif cell wall-anchored protein
VAAPAPAPAPAPTPAAPPEQLPQSVTAERTPAPKPRKREQAAVKGQVVSSPPVAKPVQAQAAQTLPFTGAETGIVAILGATSLAGGILLRRRTRVDA